MAKISAIFNKPKDPRINLPSDSWSLPAHHIGVEFEAEGVSDKILVGNGPAELYKYFSMHTDGSLRDRGQEFSFSLPLMGRDIDKALNIYQQVSEAEGFKYNDRTGLHIHMDVRDLDQINIYRLFLLYALYEYIIYDFVGDGREKSNYCIPWYRTFEQHGVMAKILQSTDKEDIWSRVNEANRYMGLNLNSLQRFGSLEFRQMQGTGDFAKIRTWINILMDLVKAAELNQNIGDAFLTEVSREGAENFSRQYMPTLRKVMPYREFQTRFFDGIELAQEIIISSAPRQYFNNLSLALLDKYKGSPKGATIFLNSLLKKDT